MADDKRYEWQALIGRWRQESLPKSRDENENGSFWFPTIVFEILPIFKAERKWKQLSKNENENGKKIWKWKRKWFVHLPTVFEKYRIFAVFYHILPIEIPYSHTMPAHPAIYIFRESWLIYPNSKSQPSDMNSWDYV